MSAELEWTEKYRPEHLGEVVGNKKQRALMMKWAEAWADGCPIDKSCEPKDEIMKKKALLLAGPPGIGKTTSALALARDMGWEVLEMNASDTRNADAVKSIALSGALTQGFSESGEYLRPEYGERKLIILDEADNLSGNADRGGMKAIIDLIKKTMQPVILIANDLHSMQRRSSFFKKKKGSPLEIIRFNRPADSEIASFLYMVAEKEGLDIDRSVIREIAVRSAGDVRGALNDLQSFAYSGADMDEVMSSGTRDRELDVKEALQKVDMALNIREAVSYLRRIDEEPSNTLLWLDELVPKMVKTPRALHVSMDHLSKADIYLSRVYRRNQYRLWSYATEEMAASILSIRERKGFPRSFFPSWLLSMGRSKGVRNIRKSLAVKMARHMHTTTNRALQDILPYFTILFNRDEEFMYEMTWKLDLSEKEVNFLIGDSTRAAFVVEKAREGRKRGVETLIGEPGSSGGKNKDESGERSEPSKRAPERKDRKKKDAGKKEKKEKEEKDVPPGQTTLF